MNLDPRLDLSLQRDVEASADDLWRAWTTPDVLMKRFCPLPWKTVECEIDLRPGGRFRTVMRSPEGQDLPPNEGCYLVVEAARRLVWTNALGPDFRPRPAPDDPRSDFRFVAEIRFEPLSAGTTRYHALVMHADEAGRNVHAAMGFEQGWTMALNQLVALIRAGG